MAAAPIITIATIASALAFKFADPLLGIAGMSLTLNLIFLVIIANLKEDA